MPTKVSAQRQNFFDTTMGAVSFRTLFAGTRRSHGRSNCKFDAALGLLNLWHGAKPVCRSGCRGGAGLAKKEQAHVAQLVEHVLGKDEVTGSIPVMGSVSLPAESNVVLFNKGNDKWPRKHSNTTSRT